MTTTSTTMIPARAAARLSGKVAVVTGAGQGVGRGIALALAESGAAVVLVGRTLRTLESVAEEIRATGGTADSLVIDITDETAVESIIATAVMWLGSVDILVNNANLAEPMPLDEYSDAAFRTAFEAGPRASLSLMKQARPYMVARGGGVVINLVSSAAVRWDAADHGVYAAVKEAIRSLTRAAACEWGPDGIRALTVAPHAHSPGLDWWMRHHPEEAERFIARIPAGRVGDPVADIGRPVAWLCTAEASYLTGVTIPLDGGQSRWG
ncbi:SDR family NAD(P)-dependent oxidoreductase [Dietzia sp. MNB45]|uniref:SDR family NAD(P)-dependent oxidoreductase n=1 Tax=Dietzia sp. MNB45 TaxID=3238800 RepID=UPI003F7D8B6E